MELLKQFPPKCIFSKRETNRGLLEKICSNRLDISFSTSSYCPSPREKQETISVVCPTIVVGQLKQVRLIVASLRRMSPYLVSIMILRSYFASPNFKPLASTLGRRKPTVKWLLIRRCQHAVIRQQLCLW